MLAQRMRAETGLGKTAVALVTLILGLALGAGAVWILRPSAPAPAATDGEHAEEGHAELPAGIVEVPEEALKNAQVEIAAVKSQVLPGTIEVTGAVAADESRVAHVRPLARGVVEKIAVSLGSRVSVGQTLLTYDNIELGQLVGDFLTERAALGQAQTDREVKRTTLERAEALIKIDAIARQELDVRRAQLRDAEASIASARARVSRVEEQLHRFGLTDADLEALAPGASDAPHRDASHSTLRAPLSGVVTKFDVAAGEVVDPEKELFTVADLSTVWVLADVYEKDLARILRTGTVTITVDAYPERTFTGRVTHVSDLIDPTTRTAKVRCVVENRDGALKLDMFAKVALGTNETRQALTVPTEAVQQVENQPVVFVQQNATRFERLRVEIGRRSGDVVEVTQGLTPGQKVVGKGSFYLKTALLREQIGDEH